jgi:methyl-accepting chemotaxis protein
MTMIPRTQIVPVPGGKRAIDRLADDASRLGYEIVDIASFLDHVDGASRRQIEALDHARRAEDAMLKANDAVRGSVAEVESSTGAALTEARGSLAVIREAATETTRLAEWVGDLGQRLDRVEATLAAVRGANAEIAAIASQINILAISAKIEAARAGDAGRGFAVVAEAINTLSHQTARAAAGIAGSVVDLVAWCDGMSKETNGVRAGADRLIAGAEENDLALARIADGLKSAQEGTGRIARASESADAALAAFRPAFDGIAAGTETTAAAIAQSQVRVEAMIDYSERIVQGTVAEGGTSQDARFVQRVRDDAARLSAALETAVDAGRITVSELFSDDYRPIPQTDPPQLLAPFTALTDVLFPPVQEAALSLDSRVVFCAAVDRNGYLPTHNAAFSRPQGPDPVWNSANCRNRRIFDDRVGLKAGRNTAPFLLQVYRRDMGGGEFQRMKDVSAPIMVKGRHWGGLRLAYAF